MVKNVDLLSTFMVGVALWNLFGLVQGLIQAAGQTAAISVGVFTGLIIVFLPISRGTPKWPLAVSGVLGIVGAVLATVALASGELNIGPAIFLALGVLVAVFGFMAYRQSPTVVKPAETTT